MRHEHYNLCCPAVVAWSVKALVFNSVNSSPEQAVDRISLEAKSSCVDSLNKKEGSMESGLQRGVL